MDKAVLASDNSIITESGGTANTIYSDEDEGGKQDVKEEGKNGVKTKRCLPICR